jgi:hypothetical protein
MARRRFVDIGRITDRQTPLIGSCSLPYQEKRASRQRSSIRAETQLPDSFRADRSPWTGAAMNHRPQPGGLDS